MNRKLVAGVLGVALAAFLVWFFALRDKGDRAAKPSGGSAGGGGLKDVRAPATGSATTGDEPRSGVLGWDADPVGALELEGQVLDDHDDPIQGATVSLSSKPQRTTTTTTDGTFVFDKLVGRQYAVSARSGDLIGGPVVQQLTANSPPAVIRLRRGASLIVHVVADPDAAPVKAASVELRAANAQTAVTGDDGIATLRGVEPGWANVAVTAPGFAPADAGTFVNTSAAALDVTVVMRKGAAVAGRVVDEKGAPVANAYVLRLDAGRAWEVSGSLEKDAQKTSAAGEFAFPIVSAGSFRFVAHHDRLAPATSTPVTVDGSHDVKGVEIVMKPGGVITGVVVDKDGAAVPHPSVTVAPKEVNDFQNWGGLRHVTGDAAGTFEIRALPREQVRVRAEAAAAASAVAEVDLAAKEAATVKLVLDVTGTIAGVVVDTANEPVAEVQVAAAMNLLGGDTTNYALAGFATTTTDGGGAFTIHGLADGEYQLSAHRSGLRADNSWATKGVSARTGDTKVKLILRNPGSIKGTLVLASGAAPKLATISASWQRSTPAIDGKFELQDLTPGSYDLTIRGPEFAEKVKPKVAVVEDKVTDAGTIKLERGRRLVGTVVDGEGRPVEGARVRVGKFIVAEGGTAGASDPNLDQLYGQRVTTTGADGGFALVGIAKDGGSVAAEHVDRGRSNAVKLPAGQGDPPAMKLVLRGYGSIAGVVTAKGQPSPAMVLAMPKAGGAQLVSVQAGPDGSYVIEKVAEGTHRLTAIQQGIGSMSSSDEVDVEVKAGQRAVKNLELPSGDLTIAIEIKPKAGATLDAAQVFVFRGVVAAKNVKELTELFTAGGPAAAGMKFWMKGQVSVAFEELVPGRVSVCSIPITGDLNDPQVAQRLTERAEELAIYCMGVELPASPKQQTYTQELPAMTPLAD